MEGGEGTTDCGVSFLIGYSGKKPTGRRKDEREERKRDENETTTERVTRTAEWHEGVDRTERERNDNPFDGHNAAQHRKAHQTRNTANRPPSPFRPLHRRLSICVFIFLQLPKPRSELTPGYMQTATVPPGQS